MVVVWLNSIMEMVYSLLIASPPTGTPIVYTPDAYEHGASRPTPNVVEAEWIG